jgi:ribosomal-protein-alanine N-acetyltransferase
MIHRPRSGTRQAGLIAQDPGSSIRTDRLRLEPIPPAAAAALPADRVTAARLIGAALSPAWPQPDLLDLLPHQATAPPWQQRFGVWAIVERRTETVIGDIGFHGPPDATGMVEVGYSVIPDRRRRGYATEAATALVAWALVQPAIRTVAARCEADNPASIRTLERVGFERVAEADGIIAWRRPV